MDTATDGAPSPATGPRVVCIGGSLRAGSSSAIVARWVASALAARGADVASFVGDDLDLPLFRPDDDARTDATRRMVRALGESDAVVLVSPTYHGAVSGPVKNALDYVNDLDDPRRPLLDGRPVGCVSIGGGAQGSTTVLGNLRTIVHALRGWPTPLGVTVFGDETPEDPGAALAPELAERLDQLVDQVVRAASRTAPAVR